LKNFSSFEDGHKETKTEGLGSREKRLARGRWGAFGKKRAEKKKQRKERDGKREKKKRSIEYPIT